MTATERENVTVTEQKGVGGEPITVSPATDRITQLKAALVEIRVRVLALIANYERENNGRN